MFEKPAAYLDNREKCYWPSPNCPKKYGDLCMKIARNILNDPQDAEECVNDAWLGAWNSIPPQSPRPAEIVNTSGAVSFATALRNHALRTTLWMSSLP